jgi:DNA polymerase III delta subunit
MAVPRKTKEKTTDFSTVLKQIEEKNIAPVYFLYGEDSVALNQAKQKLVNQLIPTEFRDGNLNEVAGKGLDLMDLITLSDTYPFLSDHRVILIENYPYFSGKKKLATKPTAEVERFAEYIAEQQAGWTTIIFTFEENKEDGPMVSKTGVLMTAIKKKGIVVEFPFQGSIFDFLDSLGERNSSKTINYLYQFFHNESEEKKPSAIHKMISRNVRFWLQALLLEKGSSETDLPTSAALNLEQVHPFARSKIQRQAPRFTQAELTAAIQELVTVEDKLNPRAIDVMGEDPELILQKWIIKFCEGNA